MGIESFATTPLASPAPSYLYVQYSDDSDLQAFVSTQNSIAQGYIDWFNQTPLAVYTQPTISGPLLDWIGQGIYGIPRPVLATGSSQFLAGYDSAPYNTIAYNTSIYINNGSATPTTDDIYKRVMTWNLYRGDGKTFGIPWLKNRIARFLNGANGTDVNVLDYQPSITVSGNTFTVSAFASSNYSILQLCYSNDALILPFQYQLTFVTVAFINDGGLLQMVTALSYPSSPTSLPAGSVWYNGGLISVVPGITPNPLAPPLYFATTTPTLLLATGGGNLPLTMPTPGSGQLWNNGGVIAIA